jgi:hypothetical protein
MRTLSEIQSCTRVENSHRDTQSCEKMFSSEYLAPIEPVSSALDEVSQVKSHTYRRMRRNVKTVH